MAAGLGWKAWTRERLSRVDLQGYLQDQVVARFTSAAARTAQLVAPGLNQVSVRDDAPGRLEFWDGDSWEAVDGAMAGRVTFATASVASGSALHVAVAIPAAPFPSRITLTATGKGGFAAAARVMRWFFDSFPAGATNVVQDDDSGAVGINLAATAWGTLSYSAAYDLPAGAFGSFRTLMNGDGNAYSRGGVTWTRTRL